MAEKIEPALTPEEWARIRSGNFDPVVSLEVLSEAGSITREKIELMCQGACGIL